MVRLGELWQASSQGRNLLLEVFGRRFHLYRDEEAVFSKKNNPMLNPNSYAIITGKNQWGIQTDRDLQGTLTWTCLEPSLETFCLKPWNLLQRLLGTLIYLEHGNLFLEPLLAWNLHWKSLAWNLETLEPHASLSWNFWKFHLELA